MDIKIIAGKTISIGDYLKLIPKGNDGFEGFPMTQKDYEDVENGRFLVAVAIGNAKKGEEVIVWFGSF